MQSNNTATRKVDFLKRLCSNLRPTTLECLHLLTRGHFRSRDEDGGHTTLSAITEYSMQHAKPHGSTLYRTGVMAS